MRAFITSFLGSLIALVLFTAALACVVIVTLFGIALSSSASRESLEDGSYLVFNLETNINDAPDQFDWSLFGGGKKHVLQLRSVVQALDAAARDKRIAGILLTGSFEPDGYGTGFAALSEVKAALGRVRAAGKPVKAYLNDAGLREYYLAAGANEIIMDPYGTLLIPGLAAQPVFFKGAFEKFGIGVQVTRVGKYKSAIEPFVRKDLSQENREQLQQLLGEIWGSLLVRIEADRKIPLREFQKLVDDEALIQPARAKQAQLVDRVAYRDELIEELRRLTNQTDPKETFRQISLEAYAQGYAEDIIAKAHARSASGRIALLYAEGDIVDGEGIHGQVGGTSLAREIRRLRRDDEVKAIVLRVNSPGGSASASEHIQRELVLARKIKPVIISMGSYAASGGYWISTYGDRIFAEAETITGSIGVFGVFFDVEKLAANLGLSFDRVKTGDMADALTITRPKTEKELNRLQSMIDWIYGEFVGKVADARQLDRKQVEEIAQGRVWSGSAAKRLGLVDEIGGLEDALRYAATKAGLGEHPEIEEYPRKKMLSDMVEELMQDWQARALADKSLVTKMRILLQREAATLSSFNDPKGAYARMPVTLHP